MPERHSWPVVLELVIAAKRELHRRDPDDSDDQTMPRLKLAPEELKAFERENGEPFAPEFRDFLLHANGWEGVYYDLDLFGLPEMQGGGRWAIAKELLGIYTEERVLATIGLEPEGVIPIAAGDGTDLVLLIRPGWEDEGQVSWILGGEEYVRAEDYQAFVESIMTRLQT